MVFIGEREIPKEPDWTPQSHSYSHSQNTGWLIGGPVQQNMLVELSPALINGWWSVSKQCLCKGCSPSNPTVALTAGFSLADVVIAACPHSALCGLALPARGLGPPQQPPQLRASVEVRGEEGRRVGSCMGPGTTFLLLQVVGGPKWQVRSLRRPRHCLCCGAGTRCQVLGFSWYLSM